MFRSLRIQRGNSFRTIELETIGFFTMSRFLVNNKKSDSVFFHEIIKMNLTKLTKNNL